MVAVTKDKKEDETLKIFISETTGPIGTKLCLDSPWMIPFQNCVPIQTSNQLLLKIEKGGMKFLKKSSETTGPIGSKLC